jgi:EAL domain-containing protein (putative c-di-GMP-specific phosphodiesterase class I)
VAGLGNHDRRLQSLVLYGLTGPEVTVDLNDPLAELVALAREVTGADDAAIVVFDGSVQMTIAATVSEAAAGLPPRVERSCAGVLSGDVGQDAVQPDADDEQDVGLYAAAPLVGQEGVGLGVLCVWSADARILDTRQRRMLWALGKSVIQVLDERRRARELRPMTRSRPPASLAAVVRPSSGPTIDEIIDERLVRALFQPVVYLATGQVVGFEALARGPQGSALEAPNALIDAARAVGRLGELDWVCRTAALRTAMRSGYHPSISWFVNVEPAGLRIACPEDLAAIHAQARDELRVVLELTERDAQGDVTGLLDAAAQARASTWGVAVDDVGTESMSLALLPLLQPDVVKLDMRALGQLTGPSAISLISAVRAYVERSGAVTVAEGVETAAQQDLAMAYGASYGQGYRFGRPAPLPASVAAPLQPVPLRQRLPPPTMQTPFEAVSLHVSPGRAEQPHLIEISEHLERRGLIAVEAGVLMTCFQRPGQFTDMRRAQYLRLSTINAYTVVAGSGLTDLDTPRYRVAHLAAANPMARDWLVIFLGPQGSAALLARHCREPSRSREFDFVYTHDQNLVVLAARNFLGQCSDPADHAGLLPSRPDSIDTAKDSRARPATATPKPSSAPRRWFRGN